MGRRTLSSLVAAQAVVTAITLAPCIGHAHPAAAAPPDFGDVDCISVIDKREASELRIPYTQAFDDVALEVGDIAVADAKSHQFFAFRGALAAHELGHRLWPFAVEAEAPHTLPSWIDAGDIERAARAVTDADGTGFSAERVAAGDVLDDRVELQSLWLRITSDAARVPITQAQAAQGVRWDLSEVPAGVYSVAGYVFSPPWNGWAPRPGVVKVLGDGPEPPALTVDPINAVLLGAQGRRVRGCVDAPPGSTLRALYRIEERPELGFMPFTEEREVESGVLELCFVNPRRDLTGSVRIRLEVRTPDGLSVAAHSPDSLVWLSGGERCVSDATCCCPVAREGEPAGTEAQATSSPSVVPPGCAIAPPGARASPGLRAATSVLLIAWFGLCARAHREARRVTARVTARLTAWRRPRSSAR